MSNQPMSPFFGAYNARHLNPEEVAHEFVPPTLFKTLIGIRNTLLVGPRGSGKTHLLKMLQPKALAAWTHPQAMEVRTNLQYYGVFVAADVMWKAQVEERSRPLPPSLAARYAQAVFILHFRESLVSCMLQLTHDRPRNDEHRFLRHELTATQEAALVSVISNSWRLNPQILSLLSLRQCIVDKLSDFRLAHAEGEATVEDMVRQVQPDILSTARQAVEAFNSVTGLLDARWALCFDELEIAPEAVQQELLECLRSTDRRLLFKLAISPFSAHTRMLNNVTTASASNDYDTIPLWFTNTTETTNFCLKLWEHKTRGTPANGLPPSVVLHHSKFHFYDPDTDGPSRYAKSGLWATAFSSLASIDTSFAKYLETKGIRPSALDSTSPELMDQVVRKVAPLVGYRNAYLSSSDLDIKTQSSRILKRKIKTPPQDIFSGWEAICLATEGNPRWFNGLITRLISRWEPGAPLSRATQAREFTVASEKFLAWISAVPVPVSNLTGDLRNGIRGLVDVLGAVFRAEALDGEFSADPVLAFKVNKDLPDAVKELLVAALNVGALVSMSTKEVDFTLSNLDGHKFRLVHLLAPKYRLPLRAGEERSLQRLMLQYSRMSTGEKNSANPTILNSDPTRMQQRQQKDLF
jgi:hypothetical protein